MAKVKKDDKFCCADCGLEVVVNKACSCTDTELICCGGPMIKGKSASGQAKKSDSSQAKLKSEKKTFK